MKFHTQKIEGVFEITLERHTDERGYFSRAYCPNEFERAGIDFNSTQINFSENSKKHTLRGLHYQHEPFSEIKLVRCLRGYAFDVVVDIRSQSETFGQWLAFDLDAKKMNAVLVPKGCAHGFLTLEDETLLQYQMGQPHMSGKAAGIAWNDPSLAIGWPHKPALLSSADQNWPAFSESSFKI